MNGKWEAAEEVINIRVGISVCEVQPHCKIIQLAGLGRFTTQ